MTAVNTAVMRCSVTARKTARKVASSVVLSVSEARHFDDMCFLFRETEINTHADPPVDSHVRSMTQLP